MTAVDILQFIVKHMKELLNLEALSPGVQVLGMLPENDPRYEQGGANLVDVLRGLLRRKRSESGTGTFDITD